MNFELFIVLVLIFVFLLSCGGLIQKIREGYEERTQQIISAANARVSMSQQTYQNEAYFANETGVFPGGLCPPPYTGYNEPPPKYEEVIKDNVTINIEPVPIHTTQRDQQNENNRI